MEQPSNLVPATPDVQSSVAYGPKIPWKLLAIGAACIAGATGFYQWQQHQKIEKARTQLLTTYQKLETNTHSLESLRGALKTLTAEVIDNPATQFSKEGFSLRSIADQKGLYLRIDPTQTREVTTAALKMRSDSLAGCLGVEATSARVLYEEGSFLSEEWIRRGRKTSNMIKLRVMQDELERRVKRDLPTIDKALEASWILLVVDRISLNKQVDVFLWDLSNLKLLFSTRIQPDGILVPIRVALPGVPYQKPIRIKPRSKAALDCSIAGNIRALATK